MRAATACWKPCAGRSPATGQEVCRSINHLFLFIGAEPNTDWLKGSGIGLDAKGFILTGEDAGGRPPLLGDDPRGVFAIGDVRAKSVKRVAAAVGEGAQVVAALHAYLVGSETNLPPAEIKKIERERRTEPADLNFSRPPMS